MDTVYSKCGFICGNCASYRENLKTAEARKRCSDGWYKYLGYRLSPEKLKPCDGCQTPDEENPLLYINCKVRKCAVMNGVATCAHCSGFPCEDTQNISFTADKRQKIEKRLGYTLSEEDYLSFVECFEGMKHLKGIRSELKSEEIVEMKTFSAVPRTAKFPENLSLTEGETEFLKKIYSILNDLDSAENTTFARKIVLGKRRPKILKLLWMFGLFGDLRKNGTSFLVVDSETFSEQKINSYYHIVLEYFSVLEKYRIKCEIVPEIEDGWKTPQGGLRKKGWKMLFSFDMDEYQNIVMLSLLQNYTRLVKEKYGDRAFRYFSRADMGVFEGG
ncbi:MAG: DUF3795 domain-containing protein [bacterium]|nr:DUF3795 domain-containing protein [bacterium]